MGNDDSQTVRIQDVRVRAPVQGHQLVRGAADGVSGVREGIIFNGA